jgi:hypothetical protein
LESILKGSERKLKVMFTVLFRYRDLCHSAEGGINEQQLGERCKTSLLQPCQSLFSFFNQPTEIFE